MKMHTAFGVPQSQQSTKSINFIYKKTENKQDYCNVK